MSKMLIRKRYYALYQISGDGGVSDRGVYLFQTDDAGKIEELADYLGGLCDDRCLAHILYTNVHY